MPLHFRDVRAHHQWDRNAAGYVSDNSHLPSVERAVTESPQRFGRGQSVEAVDRQVMPDVKIRKTLVQSQVVPRLADRIELESITGGAAGRIVYGFC